MGADNHYFRVGHFRYSLMMVFNADADDVSSVFLDGSNVAPGLVSDDEEEVFARKVDDGLVVEEQDRVCAAGLVALLRRYIANYVRKSFVSHAAWAVKFLQFNRFQKVPILMDSIFDKVCAQVEADRRNELVVPEFVGRTGKAVIFAGGHNGKSANQPALNANFSDSENFRGMAGKLVICEGARVLLNHNIWIEAGLMNGAIGTLKGFMWPEGGDPNSTDSTKRCPLCLIVEFDNVNLKDENSQPRTLFPGQPDKARWVPVFRKSVNSLNREGMYGAQFSLVSVSALSLWRIQGRTF